MIPQKTHKHPNAESPNLDKRQWTVCKMPPAIFPLLLTSFCISPPSTSNFSTCNRTTKNSRKLSFVPAQIESNDLFPNNEDSRLFSVNRLIAIQFVDLTGG